MNKETVITKVEAKSLPASCPPKEAEAWDMHPRVYLDFKQGKATCPYCNAQYELIDD